MNEQKVLIPRMLNFVNTRHKYRPQKMKVVLGAMEFGRRLPREDCRSMIDMFLTDHQEIDTAEMYSKGLSETIIGSIENDISKQGGLVSTKIYPLDDGFKPEIFENRFIKCLERLQMDFVDILYLHWPCKTHPLPPLLGTVSRLCEKGLFKRFGISNYPSWRVAQIYEYCEHNGFITPSVYQVRDVEKELFPCLREYNMSFYAYNPLAGGILTGKYQYDDIKAFDEKINCRFHGVGGDAAKMYQDRFWHKPYFDALQIIQPTLETTSLIDMSFSWLINHSYLSDNFGDAVIIGASSLDQYRTNIQAIDNPVTLSKEILDAVNHGYSIIKGCEPSYHR